MFGFIKEKEFFHPFVIWLILLLWYLIFAGQFFSLPQIKLDNFVGEQSFWFFNQPQKQAKEITIVAIDEASRRYLNLKWPWKRSITAKLIRNIASFSPKVIGLDIVFSGKSLETEDKALISAFRSHPSIVLAYVLHKNSQEKPAKDFIDATSSIGFVNKPLHGGVITKARTFHVYDEKEVVFSLEVEVLLSYLDLDRTQIRVNRHGIFAKDKLLVPSTNGIIPINYLVHPSNFKIIPASLVLQKSVNALDFKDKIVLVGVTDPLIHDQYPTPFGIWPGVTIIGNSLVMLLGKRFIYTASTGQNFAFILLLGLIIIFMNMRFNFRRNTILTLLFLGVTCFSFVYLRARDIHFAYLSILFSGTSAYVVPNLYRYLNLLYLGNRLKNLAITDPLTGLYSPRFFLLQLDEKLKGKDELVFVALRIGNYKRLTLRLRFEQMRSLTRLLGEHLQAEVKHHFRMSSFSRISNDILGVIIERAKKEEIEAFLRALIEKIGGLDWDLEAERIRISLQGCLIVRSKANSARSGDVIYQMENVFKKTEVDQIVVEDLEEVVGKGRKTRYQDILDFIAYDWEERNKDLERSLREILEANKRLDKLNWGALTALARAIDAKSKWTAGHSERVTKLALKMGRVLGLTQEELDNLNRAGLLHDVGKIGTPAELIDKPVNLTAKEHQIIREHPSIGKRILEPIEAYAGILPMVEQHHEWFNGMGYPEGRVGEAINLGARILAVADVYDALSSERPYRAAMTPTQALQTMKQNSGIQFDPVVLNALIKVMSGDGELENDSQANKVSFPKPKFR
ncbi:MAG: CHASE2 domain-containing protein [Desulfobacteraceae bacterium]|jgi:putative nucleotidyltransferase with HDIG domain